MRADAKPLGGKPHAQSQRRHAIATTSHAARASSSTLPDQPSGSPIFRSWQRAVRPLLDSEPAEVLTTSRRHKSCLQLTKKFCIIVVDHRNQLPVAIKRLKASMKGPLLGLAFKWDETAGGEGLITLLQIASESCCLLIRVAACRLQYGPPDELGELFRCS